MKIHLSSRAAFAAVLCFSGCKPVPFTGSSAAYEDPVPDGVIILVRDGNDRGAFILRNQTDSPETTDYQWFARSDGGGLFSFSDPAVTTGSKKDADQVEFSVFSIDWSINTNGKGWIYYSLTPDDTTSKPTFEMCVTDETDITKIDANDDRWEYRGKPSAATSP